MINYTDEQLEKIKKYSGVKKLSISFLNGSEISNIESDRICWETFELIESLPSDGFAILNGDDNKQVNYKLKNKVRTIWIGIDNKDVDYLASNIKCSNKGTSFKIYFKSLDKSYDFHELAVIIQLTVNMGERRTQSPNRRKK